MMINEYKIFRCKNFSLLHGKGVFKVNTDALLLAALCPPSIGPILDIGCGSGIVSLILAQRNEASIIDAIDIDDESKQLATLNFKNSPFAPRMNAYLSDWNVYDIERRYKLIVSNPPFYTTYQETASPHTTRAKHIGLGNSASTLVSAVSRLLSHEGIFSVIGNEKYIAEVVAQSQKSGLALYNKINIYSKRSRPINRIVTSFGYAPQTPDIVEDDLVIYEEDGTKTASYLALMRPFLTRIMH